MPDYANSSVPNLSPKATISIIVAILIVIVGYSSYYQINAGETGVLLVFGKISGAPKSEGPHFKIPFFSEVVVYDVKTQKATFRCEASSKDLQQVVLHISVNYSLNQSKIGDIHRELGKRYESKVIDPKLQEAAKAAAASFTLENLIKKRADASQSVMDVLLEKFKKSGIELEAVLLTNLEYSEAYSKSIEAKQIAEQEALRAENELKRIEIEAKQKIAIAAAEAEAIKIKSEALSKNKDLIQFNAVEKWNGQLPIYMMGGASVPFISLPKGQ